MMKKKPPVNINKAEMEYLDTLNERDRRHFIACKAWGPNGSSIKAVCEAFGCSPNTVSKAIFELMNHIAPPDGRQRMPGGGAKRKIDKHPEWVADFDDIVSGHMAGLPQDESVVWLDLTVPYYRLKTRVFLESYQQRCQQHYASRIVHKKTPLSFSTQWVFFSGLAFLNTMRTAMADGSQCSLHSV